MMVDEKLLTYIKGMIDTNADPLIACAWVNKLHNHGGKDKRLLLISESSAYFLSKTPFSKSMSISRHFFWFKISDIKFISNTNFHMFFDDGDMNIQHKDAKVILVVILTHLMEIFAKDERSKLSIDFSTFNFTAEFPINFVIRFRAISLSLGYKPAQSVVDFLAAFINKKMHELNLSELESNELLLEPLLRSFMLAPFIKSITVPPLVFPNMWKCFTKYIEVNTTVKSLEFHQRLTHDFVYFCEAVCRNQQLEIQSLSFNCAEFTPEYIDSLSTMVHVCGLSFLSINNSMGYHIQKHLFTRIMEVSGYKSLKILNLDNTRPLDIKGLFDCCVNIRSVSLKNCDIQIADFLKLVSLTPSCHFESLFLTGNLCTKNISHDYRLPEELVFIDLGNIKWCLDSLQSLFQICAAHKPKSDFHLVIHDSSLRNEQWESFFASLKSLPKFNLSSLVWDGNPVSVDFFGFLSRLERLTALSLSRTFEPSKTELTYLIQYLRSNNSLRNLVLRGEKGKELGMSISEVFEALKMNRFIHILDISFNKITSIGMLELGRVLSMNWVIDTISFDGAGVDSASIYDNFLSLLEKRGAPLDIVWPESDFSDLIKKGIMDEEHMNHIKSRFQSLYKGNSSIPIPEGALPHSTFNSSNMQFMQMFRSILEEEDDIEEDEEEEPESVNILFQHAEYEHITSSASDQQFDLSVILNLPQLPLFPSNKNDVNTDPSALSLIDNEMPPLFAFPKFDDIVIDSSSQNNSIPSMSNIDFPHNSDNETELISLSLDEWSLPIPSIPKINNDEIIDKLAGMFSTSRLHEILKNIVHC